MAKKKIKKTAMSRRELYKEISNDTQLKTDVVESVMNSFVDIFIRECVMTGKFNMNGAFSVDTHVRKESMRYNVALKENLLYPETEVLSIKLSPKINSFHRWKKRHENNEKYGMTIDDWREMKERRKNSQDE